MNNPDREKPVDATREQIEQICFGTCYAQEFCTHRGVVEDCTIFRLRLEELLTTKK